MEFTSQQREALEKASNWADNAGPGDIFRLFGYAGTGKSTIAEELANRIGRDKVMFTAFTGKAVEVLRQKGCHEAQTIHSLIYNTTAKHKHEIDECREQLKSASGSEKIKIEAKLRGLIKKATEPSFTASNQRTEALKEKYNLIIVDECSMIDEIVGGDLMATNLPLLVMGDPGQLPPPKGLGYFNGKADVVLDEIHRQAEGSPILTAATYVRNNQSYKIISIDSPDFKVISKATLTQSTMLNADLIIVGANKTRIMLNDKIRKLKGYSGSPKTGERLICLKNNNAQDKNFQNGAMFTLLEDAKYEEETDSYALVVENLDTGKISNTIVHAFHFRGEKSEKPWWELDGKDEFYFGYAITCHKAQGSQADNVVIMNEAKFFRQDANKWLYTAITRAAKKCTIVN